VIECASVTEQPTLDRYIRGEDVPRAQLERVWKATSETTNGFCDAPAYPDFLSAVRNVNSRLPVEARIRVLGGHPGPGASEGIEITGASVLKEQVFGKHGKALLVFGAAHSYRNLPSLMLASMGDGIGLVRRLEADYPRRTFVVIPVGPLDPPRGVTEDIVPDFQKFDRALRTPLRPVLVSLHELPFRDFKAEEFIGRTVTHCDRARGCESAFSTGGRGDKPAATITVQLFHAPLIAEQTVLVNLGNFRSEPADGVAISYEPTSQVVHLPSGPSGMVAATFKLMKADIGTNAKARIVIVVSATKPSSGVRVTNTDPSLPNHQATITIERSP
jgi:hypothetical protein